MHIFSYYIAFVAAIGAVAAGHGAVLSLRLVFEKALYMQVEPFLSKKITENGGTECASWGDGPSLKLLHVWAGVQALSEHTPV